MQQIIVWLLITLAVAVTGCNTSAPPQRDFVITRGKLSIGHRAVPSTMVMLMPISQGLRARGMTNKSGEFTLLSEDGSPGIIAGEYVVILKTMKLGASDQRKTDLLDGFETMDSSPIHITIAGDTDFLNINLKDYLQ